MADGRQTHGDRTEEHTKERSDGHQDHAAATHMEQHRALQAGWEQDRTQHPNQQFSTDRTRQEAGAGGNYNLQSIHW